AGDVNAQLHRRRAVEKRERPLPEVVLAHLALIWWDLCCVLLGVQTSEPEGYVSVQVSEERIDPSHCLTFQTTPKWIVCPFGAVATDPADRGGLEAVARYAIGVGGDLGEGPDIVQRLEEVADYFQCLLG